MFNLLCSWVKNFALRSLLWSSNSTVLFNVEFWREAWWGQPCPSAISGLNRIKRVEYTYVDTSFGPICNRENRVGNLELWIQFFERSTRMADKPSDRSAYSALVQETDWTYRGLLGRKIYEWAWTWRVKQNRLVWMALGRNWEKIKDWQRVWSCKSRGRQYTVTLREPTQISQFEAYYMINSQACWVNSWTDWNKHVAVCFLWQNLDCKDLTSLHWWTGIV